MTPCQHRPVVVHQGNGCGHMELPSPGMIRNPGAHFDQPGYGVARYALYQHPKLKKLVAEMVTIYASHTLPDCKFSSSISTLI